MPHPASLTYDFVIGLTESFGCFIICTISQIDKHMANCYMLCLHLKTELEWSEYVSSKYDHIYCIFVI